MDKFNYTMLCDFYELTMGNGYFVSGMQEKISYFDLFFRQIPDGGGFAIACGLEQVIDYIENLHFDQEDIEFLRSKGIFDEGFLDYLKDFRFTGDIFAVPEGTVVFPNEPIITVRAPAVQAQLVETYLLLCINHQTLIATKANRIVRELRAGRFLNLVQDVLMVQMLPYSVQEPQALAVAQAQPALSQTSFSASMPQEQWHIHGCRCLTASLKLSRPTVSAILMALFCLWTLTMC